MKNHESRPEPPDNLSVLEGGTPKPVTETTRYTDVNSDNFDWDALKEAGLMTLLVVLLTAAAIGIGEVGSWVMESHGTWAGIATTLAFYTPVVFGYFYYTASE